MKRRYTLLLIISMLVIAVIYLWNGKSEKTKAYHAIYQTQLAKDIEFLTTTIMLHSIPNTFELHHDEFTVEEYSLFKNSLQNINRELSVASANIKKIEDIDDRDHHLSEAINKLYELFHYIQEDAEKIENDVFVNISEITPDYSRELNDIFYQPESAEVIFKKGPDVLEEMHERIEVMLNK